MAKSSPPPSRRAVVVAGARTPFVKAFAELVKLDTIALGAAAVKGLLARTNLGHKDVESIVWGGVILPGGAPNVGREIALDLKLDPSCEGMTVTRACASGLQAITTAVATPRSSCRRRSCTRWRRSPSASRRRPTTSACCRS
jgi:acetyl-CoA acyltransferase